MDKWEESVRDKEFAEHFVVSLEALGLLRTDDA